MPRRKLTGPVKTASDIRRLISEYRSPVARRRERLQQFSGELIRLRREGAPWADLWKIVSDPDHPFPILEIKDFIEPLLDQMPTDAPMTTPPATPRPPAARRP